MLVKNILGQRLTKVSFRVWIATLALITSLICTFPASVENAFSATTLTWTAPTTNTDGTTLTDLAGFKIYYGSTSGNYLNSINVGNATTYTFNNLTPGTTSYFVATAYDSAGNESVDSNEVAKTEPAVAPPACTSYTYTSGACQSNNTALVISYVGAPAGCSGGLTPATTQPCTYVPPVCSTFTYSAWGTCQSNNTQTRTVLTSSPSGCAGGSPVTTQSCTYVPPTQACTSFSYTLGACQSNNIAPVTSHTGVPAGCSSGLTPATTQPCTYVPPVCSYTYSGWGACQSNNTQTRTVASSTPSGCTGTPVTSQACTYVSGGMNVAIGVFRRGSWYENTSRTGIWKQGVDTSLAFGVDGDIPVIGDWDGSGTKRIGVFRDGMWYLDMNGNGAWDAGMDTALSFGMKGDIPVVGDWNGSGTTKIGVFRNGTWYLDYPGTGKWVGCGAPSDPTKDACIPFGVSGDIPIAADWNGSGTTKIGVFRNGTWYLDYPGTGKWVGCGAPSDPTKDSCINFGMTGDVPVAADWNGSGTIKIGVFRQGTWYLDMIGNGTWTPGVDASLPFGTVGDNPIVKQ